VRACVRVHVHVERQGETEAVALTAQFVWETFYWNSEIEQDIVRHNCRS